jgi:DNA-binding response OmpR family regulator
MTDKILLVDDDATLRHLFSEYLRDSAFEVIAAAGGQEALRLAYSERPDLVIVDVMMPGMDGWETCARLRELSNVPVILLTAKATETDKLRGFRLGADDYVTKPFSFAEVTARIQAVLARSRVAPGAQHRVYTLGDLVVDADRRTVEVRGQPMALTPTEFRLLECLAQKAGQAVAEGTLAQEAWGEYKQEDVGAVRRYIWLLRQKIEADPAHPKHILTVRGFGYRLE